MTTPDPILATTIGGVRVRSPVVLAAGTAGTLDEVASVIDLSCVGAVVTKSITPEERRGNDPPRVVPLRVGMLNAVGLANPGIDRFVREHGPRAAGLGCPVIASIAGFSVGDYRRVAHAMAGVPGIAAVEVNVSCPNVHGGTEFGADPGALREVLAEVRSALRDRPMIVKLAPVAVGTTATIVDLARVAVEAGAAGLTLCNTVPAMAIHVRSRRPVLSNVTGGLSGPAVHPVVVRLVHLAYQGVARDAGVPIIACGGVLGWRDAAAFVLAGASAVQVGAGSLVDLRTPARVSRGLARWARREGVASIGELTGALRTG